MTGRGGGEPFAARFGRLVAAASPSGGGASTMAVPLTLPRRGPRTGGDRTP
jgi:hypothetical protein